MSDSPNRYLIAYDITDDKRRNRVHKYLGSFGVRAQFSVFLIDVRAVRMMRLKEKLLTMIKPEEDSILVCRIGPSTQIEPRSFEYLGKDRPMPPSGPIIL